MCSHGGHGWLAPPAAPRPPRAALGSAPRQEPGLLGLAPGLPSSLLPAGLGLQELRGSGSDLLGCLLLPGTQHSRWGTHSVGGSPVTGRQLTNHAPGTEGRREWVCPLHASPAQVLRRRTRGSVAGKHPINVQTSSYTHWALLRPWESWSESSVFPTAGH